MINPINSNNGAKQIQYNNTVGNLIYRFLFITLTTNSIAE